MVREKKSVSEPKYKAVNALFTVPLFTIHEKDALNSAQLERTFPDAVRRMDDCGGFYIIYDRDFAYTQRTRKVVPASVPVTVAFGEKYCLEKIPEQLWLNSRIAAKLEAISLEGYQEIVFSRRAVDVLPVDAQTVVLSENAIKSFIAGSYGGGNKVIMTGYEAWVFGIHNNKKRLFTVADCAKELKYNDNLIGIRLVRQLYYDNGTCRDDEKNNINLIYGKYLSSREWVQSVHRGNRRVQEIVSGCDDQWFLDADGFVCRIIGEHLSISDKTPEKWM